MKMSVEMASPHTRPRRAPMPPFEYLLETTSDAPAADPARPSPRHRQRAEGCGRIDHTFHCQKTSIHTDFKSNIQNSKSPNTYWFHIEQNLKSSIQISKSPNTYWFHIEHIILKSNIPISYLITYALDAWCPDADVAQRRARSLMPHCCFAFRSSHT